MSIITRMRKQKAAYWGAPVPDGRGGFTYSAAIEIRCRWEDQITQYLAKNGEERSSQAVVYVDRELDEGGYLRLGELTGSENANPLLETGAWRIERVDALPNLKNTEVLRTVYL